MTLLDTLFAEAEEAADAVRARKRATWYATHTDTQRCVRGSAHYRAKLTEAQVLEVRAARASGETFVSIAARYGVHKSTIQYAVKRGWKSA